MIESLKSMNQEEVESMKKMKENNFLALFGGCSFGVCMAGILIAFLSEGRDGIMNIAVAYTGAVLMLAGLSSFLGTIISLMILKRRSDKLNRSEDSND